MTKIACSVVVGVLAAVGGTDAAAQPPAEPAARIAGLEYDVPFFPGATYDAGIPTPDSVLGFPVGSRPAMHAQIEAVLKAIAPKSSRVKLFEYGRTHEGRVLYYIVIGSEANIARLDALKADYAKLADPRKGGDVEALIGSLPALAWMAYCIHGDEMSGSDASLAVLHHLAAATGDDVKQLLDNIVVVVDPLMNPDGRDRCIRGVHENRTAQPSVDDQSLIHSGVWPSGRMNHYLFDMNRDWMFATQPESRGRIAAVRDWNPHYFMESHEMGSQDTFLFMPPREPVNPNYPANVLKWVSRFATEQGAAFDARGWRYYTGEWNEEWYPGYSSSWAAMRGCVENLYEQASLTTDGVRRPEGDGVIETYREAVHKQLVSTMANLTTLARNRREVLADFVADRRACVAEDAKHARRVFAVLPGANTARMEVMKDLVRLQGFEATVAGRAFKAAARDRLGREQPEQEFPAGTLLLPNRQPLAHLLAAMMEFDPRMTTAFLTDERRELLRFGRSKLYDITGWSIPMMFDLEAFELSGGLPAEADAAALPQASAGVRADVQAADSPIGFVIDGADDRSVAAAALLMERGVWVRVADKPFEFDGRKFPRGSVVVLRKDNPKLKDSLVELLKSAAERTSVSAAGVRTGLGAGDLPDLGGEHFVLLHAPRAAVLGREPFSPYSYGQAWYTLDHVYGVRASYLDFQGVGNADLRRYNVIIVPDGGGAEIGDKVAALKPWVEAGGTLIAIGSSAAAVASEKGIGSARVLQDVLAKPEPYVQAVIREWEGLNAAPSEGLVWSYAPPPAAGEGAVVFPWDGATGDEKPSEDELKRRDEWRRVFSPQGVLVAGRVDDRSWLTAGCTDAGYVPVMFSGSRALVVPPGVGAPVRAGVFNKLPVLPTPPAAAPAPAAAAPAASAPSPAEAGAKPAAPGSTPDSAIAGNEPSQEVAADKAVSKDKDKKAADKKDDEKPKPGWTIAPPGFELRVRMSGLLWPEASERIANSALVTRESVGAGQVILFACDPNFRAAALGTQRIFANAVVYGPGMGASQPIRP